jgi:hypothetical protein
MTEEEEFLHLAEVEKAAIKNMIEIGSKELGVSIDTPELKFDSAGDRASLMARIETLRREHARQKPITLTNYRAYLEKDAVRDWQSMCEIVCLAQRLVDITVPQ